MSTSVYRNKPQRRGPCWFVGVGLLLCGCRSPLFTASMNDPSKSKVSAGQRDSDSTQVPAWKQDFDRYVAAHSRQRSPIRQASAKVPVAGSTGRNREPVESVPGGSVVELLNRGHAAAAAGQTAQAQHAYRRVLVDDPDNTVAHHRLAIIADGQHDFDAADYHYHRALRGDRNNPDLLSDLGYSYLLQERYQESEDFLRQAVRLRPRHRRAWSNLGLLFAVQGDYDRSREAFRRSGSEREAQARLAALFPNGRPRGRPAERRPEPAQPRDSVRAPQPVPTRYSQHSQHSQRDLQTGLQRASGSTAPASGTSSVSDPGRQPVRRDSQSLTRQLQAAMQTARRQRRFDQSPLRSRDRDTSAGTGITYDPRRTTSLPANHINRAFADIDGRSRISARSRYAQRETTPPVAGRYSVADANGSGHSRPSSDYSADDHRQTSGRARSPSIPVTDTRRPPSSPNTPALSRRANSSPSTGSGSSLLWPPQASGADSDASLDGSRRAVRQTGYSNRSRQNRPAASWNDEARRAARIGLAAGPGAVLPAAPGSTVNAPRRQRSMDAIRGTTRTNRGVVPDFPRPQASFSQPQPPPPARQGPVRSSSLDEPGNTTAPRRLPHTTADRLPPSRQVFVPSQSDPTGYRMRSESARRIDPPPYRPSQRQIAADNRRRPPTVSNPLPSYRYQPLPYQSQGRDVRTGRTIQTGLNRETRPLNRPQTYRPQTYRPQTYKPQTYRQQSGVTSPHSAERFGRPRIVPGVLSSSTTPGRTGRRLPAQQGERSFAVPPANARPVVIPQQFLPR